MPDSKIDYWSQISDLTIYDAAFWMAHKFDPRDHAFDIEHKAGYADYFEGSGGLAAVHEKCELLISAIRAGRIKLSGETYLNDQTINVGKTRILKNDWLTWCRNNGYFDTANQIISKVSAHAVPVGAVCIEIAQGVTSEAKAAKVETRQADAPVPGKMPNTAIGKLAITAAWLIECEIGKRATANQVIKKLQKMEPDEPVITEVIAHGVNWVTTKGKINSYDTQTCAKTLETWTKSRA